MKSTQRLLTSRAMRVVGGLQKHIKARNARAALELKPDAAVGKQQARCSSYKRGFPGRVSFQQPGAVQDVPVETRDLDLEPWLREIAHETCESHQLLTKEMEGQPECDDTREGVACADGARQTTQDDHETDHETVEEIEPDAQSGPEASQLLCAFYGSVSVQLPCWRSLSPEPAARRWDGARLWAWDLGFRAKKPQVADLEPLVARSCYSC